MVGEQKVGLQHGTHPKHTLNQLKKMIYAGFPSTKEWKQKA